LSGRSLLDWDDEWSREKDRDKNNRRFINFCEK